MFACDPDCLADVLATYLEDAQSTFANILVGDTRQFLVAQGKRKGQCAVRSFLGSHAKRDHVVPIEGRGRNVVGTLSFVNS